MTKTNSNPYFDQNKIETIAINLSYKYDDLFEALGISLSKTSKMYIGRCPIHGGDNAGALNLYIDGYAVRGYWKCRTHHCETVFKQTIIGFVRGVLSHQYKNWLTKEDTSKMYSFKDTIDWICKFLGQNINNIQVNEQEIEGKKFIAQVNSMVKTKKKESGLTRLAVRKLLKIPSEFFLQKGYKQETLDNFDVGLCDTVGKEMYGRVVVPIYDHDKQFMIACTGRSIYPLCDNCNYYHNIREACPLNDNLASLKYSKWRNNHNSNINSYLYNYWNAKKYIRETGYVILVEGPADVWRLEELGIKNSVAIFGTEITDEQQVILEMSGALSVVVLLDMDSPGREGTTKIANKLDRSYRVYTPELSVNDPGDLTAELVNKELEPLLIKITKGKPI